jgi:quercetin dioxygenase-like cupin family protein
MKKHTMARALALMAAVAVPSAASNDRVTLIGSDQTNAAFMKGQPLVETSGYKVHASRREAPGMAEIHTLDTDIIYVLDGTATVITGGTAAGTKEVATNELRGPAIEGGTAQRLAKGDVFIVPNGVPHQFTEVSAPFLYYVVKVTAASASGGSR